MKRYIFLCLAALFICLLVMGGLKARRIYNLTLILHEDAQSLQSLASQNGSRLERIRQAGPALVKLRRDFSALKAEVAPFLWIGPWLKWVPTYGGDLAAAPDLVELADSLLATADVSYHAALPLLAENNHGQLDLPGLTQQLLDARPQFEEARYSLDLALAARSRIDTRALSPEVRDVILNKVDRLLPLLQDGLVVGLELPGLLGATEDGPRTYLLLVQNEDELRPTGGFITAVGKLQIADGEIGRLNFSGSDKFDDWTKPYPTAPWQLREYMNTPILILRDANWFADFPTAARYAKHLYSYADSAPVDGVIAVDQHMLVEVLSITGPVEVEGVDYLIDAGNVIFYMRGAKTPTLEQAESPTWDNKGFLNKLSYALMDKVLSGNVELEHLATLLIKVLNERHLLVQLDHPVVTPLLEKYHWDGSIRPARGDFLMVVDTNVGFNKTNAVVDSSLVYDVDLRKANSLTSSLTVFHTNRASGVGACLHWNKIRVEGERYYPIQDCYWNYLRVFSPQGTFLLGATSPAIPADWMIHKKRPSQAVDILEDIPSLQEFGTIQVVPASASQTTRFEFLLPVSVVQPGPLPGQWLYRLSVQKQPGTLAVPLEIHIQLPKNASVLQIPSGAVTQENTVALQTELSVDRIIEVLYSIP